MTVHRCSESVYTCTQIQCKCCVHVCACVCMCVCKCVCVETSCRNGGLILWGHDDAVQRTDPMGT